MRNIAVLQTVTIVPAMPPPTAIFDTLICGLRASSRIPHLLALSYHEFTSRSSPISPTRSAIPASPAGVTLGVR